MRSECGRCVFFPAAVEGVGVMIKADRVEVVEYDAQWPRAFDEIKSVVEKAVGKLALRIEHVGSTAIPGLSAKPIIDLDIVIGSHTDLPEVIARLSSLGYIHEGDLGIRGREAFKREGEDVPRTSTGKVWPKHHLYVCPEGSEGLTRHLAFRDYLRAHPEELALYEAVKRRLAAQDPHDWEAYTDGKTDYIVGILRRAGVAMESTEIGD
jgi:GrpB-like predicted nucleotidyltransferase (UPF0157 family)